LGFSARATQRLDSVLVTTCHATPLCRPEFAELGFLIGRQLLRNPHLSRDDSIASLTALGQSLAPHPELLARLRSGQNPPIAAAPQGGTCVKMRHQCAPFPSGLIANSTTSYRPSGVSRRAKASCSPAHRMACTPWGSKARPIRPHQACRPPVRAHLRARFFSLSRPTRSPIIRCRGEGQCTRN